MMMKNMFASRLIRPTGRLRLFSGMFKECSGGEIRGGSDGLPSAASGEIPRPEPKEGFMEGQYAVVLFNHTLDSSVVPSPRAFQLLVDELIEETPYSVSLPGGVLYLQLREPVEPGSQVLLHYYPPVQQSLQDEDGQTVEAFTIELHNLGEEAAAEKGGITWSEAEKMVIAETGGGTLEISWDPPHGNVTVYRLMIFSDGELYRTYEVPETSVLLRELEPDVEYEFLVLAVDRAGWGVPGFSARWRQPA